MGIDLLQNEDISKIISQFEEEFPKINTLTDEQKRILANMIFSAEEVVGINHLVNRLLGMKSTLDVMYDAVSNPIVI